MFLLPPQMLYSVIFIYSIDTERGLGTDSESGADFLWV
jgi:hypothetical protein